MREDTLQKYGIMAIERGGHENVADTPTPEHVLLVVDRKAAKELMLHLNSWKEGDKDYYYLTFAAREVGAPSI